MGREINNCHIDTLRIMEKRDKELSSCLTKNLVDIDNVNNTTNLSYWDQRRNSVMSDRIRNFLTNSLNGELRLIQRRLSGEQQLPLPLSDYSNRDFKSTIAKSIELLDVYAYWYALSEENSMMASKLSEQMQKYLIKVADLENDGMNK